MSNKPEIKLIKSNSLDGLASEVTDYFVANNTKSQRNQQGIQITNPRISQTSVYLMFEEKDALYYPTSDIADYITPIFVKAASPQALSGEIDYSRAAADSNWESRSVPGSYSFTVNSFDYKVDEQYSFGYSTGRNFTGNNRALFSWFSYKPSPTFWVYEPIRFRIDLTSGNGQREMAVVDMSGATSERGFGISGFGAFQNCLTHTSIAATNLSYGISIDASGTNPVNGRGSVDYPSFKYADSLGYCVNNPGDLHFTNFALLVLVAYVQKHTKANTTGGFTIGDHEDIVDTTADVVLPDPTDLLVYNRKRAIVNNSGAPINVTVDGGANINGAASVAVAANGGWIVVAHNRTEYFIVSQG